LLTIDHAPVNSLSQPMRYALWTALEQADADEAVQAIVLTGAGRGFCAGGELSELRSPVQQAWPGISNHLLARIEACRKPVIAAVHGFAVGGGLELALACHYRVAQRDARLALPEIKHGVIPPSGSQRMPRAIGVDRALQMIVLAEYVNAGTLEGTALFNRVCDGDVVTAALSFANELDAAVAPATVLLRHRSLAGADSLAGVAVWRERLRGMPNATAVMHCCVDSVEFAVRAQNFDGGLAAAKRLHDQLASAAMRDAAPSTGAPTSPETNPCPTP
ncbi:MAG TPA: enoyl-CoA hydratase/isomerase family protein, partial [Ramlibacter sp.]|nr:enoyl-CoA hydratase/isomerase family protein [Ramlibacter sp.]